MTRQEREAERRARREARQGRFLRALELVRGEYLKREGRAPDRDMAARVGVSCSTWKRWKRRPEFRDAVGRARAEAFAKTWIGRYYLRAGMTHWEGYPMDGSEAVIPHGRGLSPRAGLDPRERSPMTAGL